MLQQRMSEMSAGQQGDRDADDDDEGASAPGPDLPGPRSPPAPPVSDIGAAGPTPSPRPAADDSSDPLFKSLQARMAKYQYQSAVVNVNMPAKPPMRSIGTIAGNIANDTPAASREPDAAAAATHRPSQPLASEPRLPVSTTGQIRSHGSDAPGNQDPPASASDATVHLLPGAGPDHDTCAQPSSGGGAAKSGRKRDPKTYYEDVEPSDWRPVNK